MNSRLLSALFLLATLKAAAAGPQADATTLPNWSGYWESNVDLKHFAPAAFPYRPDWQSKAEQVIAASEGHFYCAEGMPSTMQIPDTINMFEALILPKLTVFIFSNHEVRHIYTDGRRHPAPDELWPTPEGDSVGHWQGDTLVIDTTSTKPQLMQLKPVEFNPGNVVPVSVVNTPASDRMHIVERIRLLPSGILEDKMTIEDPVAFSHPFKATYTFKRVTDIKRMVYEDCDENPRDFVRDGKAIMIEREEEKRP